jgi:hypothetical protein
MAQTVAVAAALAERVVQPASARAQLLWRVPRS